jgi:xanthine dehydrogenase accessory factor
LGSLDLASTQREGLVHGIVVPKRTLGERHRHGESAAVFGLLREAAGEDTPAALVTLVEVEGGSSRDIGAQMAVLADGRYCGYVSGGCIEAAIAAEAVKAIEARQDTTLRFGVGSPFFDIKLPCGGSIEVHVHQRPDPALVAEVATLLGTRRAFGLELTPSRGTASLVIGPDLHRTGWRDETFRCHYAPVTRLLLVGRGVELERAVQLAMAAGLDVVALCADDPAFSAARAAGASALRLDTPHDVPDLPIDRWTAAVTLFHDHDWETALLRAIIDSEAFFIGAMGSRHAHKVRCERLAAAGAETSAIARIKGPVGLFGPTRDAAALAVSILADVTQQRLAFDAS